jgi:hypothetical protein
MSMLRKLETACRAAFAWEPIKEHELSDHCLIERNAVTGGYRWCFKTSPRGVPDNWKPGFPEKASVRPQPPSGGSSGVKPARPEPGIKELLEAVDDVLKVAAENPPKPRVVKEIEKPFHRLSIAMAPLGGYTVSEHEMVYGNPRFRLRFAGDMEACLLFIRDDLLRQRREEAA